jgi:hypothetical protein
MVGDIAIAPAHSGEPPVVFNGECWLNAEGRIYLAASGVNLAKDIPNNNCYDFAGCRGLTV